MPVRNCFVMIPHAEKPLKLASDADRGMMELPSAATAPDTLELSFEDVYKDIVLQAISSFNAKHRPLEIVPIRGRDIRKPGSILGDVLKCICQHEITITDITTFNPNVFLELGIRLSVRGSLNILIGHKRARLPFDLGQERCIFYSSDYRDIVSAQNEILSYLESEDGPLGATGRSTFFDPIEVHTGRRHQRELAELLNSASALLGEVAGQMSGKGNMSLRIKLFNMLDQIGHSLLRDPAGQDMALEHYLTMSRIPGISPEREYKTLEILAQLYGARGMLERVTEISARLQELEVLS